MDLLSKLKRHASRLRYFALRWQHVAEVHLALRPSDGMYGADYFGGASKDATSPDSASGERPPLPPEHAIAALERRWGLDSPSA